MTPRHRRKLKEPLVSIRADRLATALAVAGVSARRAATILRRAGVPVVQQTLQLVLAGEQARVRRPVFHGLVRLLRGPFAEQSFGAWLRGEGDAPGEAVAGVAATEALGVRRLEAPSMLIAPLAHLTIGRDAEEIRARAVAERPSRARAEAWHPVTVGGLVQSAYDPSRWRRALLRSDESLEATPDELDGAAEALSQFLRITLRPWLTGRARLRPDAAEAAADLLRQLLGGPARSPRPRARR